MAVVNVVLALTCILSEGQRRRAGRQRLTAGYNAYGSRGAYEFSAEQGGLQTGGQYGGDAPGNQAARDGLIERVGRPADRG